MLSRAAGRQMQQAPCIREEALGAGVGVGCQGGRGAQAPRSLRVRVLKDPEA